MIKQAKLQSSAYRCWSHCCHPVWTAKCCLPVLVLSAVGGSIIAGGAAAAAKSLRRARGCCGLRLGGSCLAEHLHNLLLLLDLFGPVGPLRLGKAVESPGLLPCPESRGRHQPG
ncbi:hypothetical protein ABPG77_004686 [Micractinium sp. CCAP 211/92]